MILSLWQYYIIQYKYNTYSIKVNKLIAEAEEISLPEDKKKIFNSKLKNQGLKIKLVKVNKYFSYKS